MRKMIPIAALLLCCCFGALAQQNEQAELPPVRSGDAAAFFIPAGTLAPYKLTAGKGDAWMKVYHNTADSTKVQQLNDIRWEGSTKEEAMKWYGESKSLLSENGKEITGQLAKPAGVDAWNVYEQSEGMKSLMESLGMKQQQYNFTFVVNRYVAKIFISGSTSVSLKEAWAIAREGLKAILKASGNPKMAELVL